MGSGNGAWTDEWRFAVCTGAIPDVKMSLFGVGVDLVVLVALVSVDVVEIFFSVCYYC